jgi:transposase
MCVGSSVTTLTAVGRSRRERLPAFVLPWARLTVRLCEALHSLGLATCAELGTRLAERLAIQTSPTTILRRLMVLPNSAVERIVELGIDDFAFRRGKNFGTILVDLQSHKVLDPRRLIAKLKRQKPG